MKVNCAVLTVMDTKNRAHVGRLQVRMVREPTYHCGLAVLVDRELSKILSVVAFLEVSLNRCLCEALNFFDFGHLKLSPASLRTGGASLLVEQGVPVANIGFAGCWASEKALSSYFQEAEAASTLLQVSSAQARRLELFLKRIPFDRVPEKPFLPL